MRVTGRVLVLGSREPIAGASLLVADEPIADTDAAGVFSFELPAGSHVVRVVAPRHVPRDHTFVLDAARPPAPVELRLEPRLDVPAFETTVVSRTDAAPSVRLEQEELRRTPGAMGDPFRAVESLPGVTPVVFPLPVYTVRGSNPGTTGFFVDGLRVPALFHFALGPAVIPAELVESLELYPGGYPARFGRAASGIVSTTTAGPPADRLRGTAEVRLLDAGGFVSTPVGDDGATVALSGRYGYPGFIASMVQDDVDIAYLDYQARAEVPAGRGRATLFAFGSYDHIAPQSPDPDDPLAAPELTVAFHRLDLRWRGPLGAARLAAALAGGLDETSTPFESTRITVRSRGLTPRLQLDVPLGDALDLETGLDGEWVEYDSQLGTGGLSLADFARPRTTMSGAAWGAVTHRAGERVLTTAGVRLDAFRERGVTELDVAPRLQVRVQVADPVWLHAAGGRATQMPSLPVQLPGFEGFGLRQLGLQHSWQGSAGAEVRLPAAITADVTGFVQRSVLTDVRDPELGDPLLDDFLTSRDALAYGLELLVRRALSERLHGWLSYTLSRAERQFEGRIVGPSDWDPRHALNVLASYRLGRWVLGGRFHLHSGRPVRVEDTSPPEYQRLPTFAQLDLRAERRFLFERWALDAYLEVINVTATREIVGYRAVDGELQEQGFRIAVPSLGARATW